MAPVVVDLHEGLLAGRRHAGLGVELTLLRRCEGDVVDPHRQAVAGRDVAAPVGLLADVVHVEERQAAAVAEVEEDVAQEAAARMGRDLCVDEREAELLLEAGRLLDVLARLRDVVDPGHGCLLGRCVARALPDDDAPGRESQLVPRAGRSMRASAVSVSRHRHDRVFGQLECLGDGEFSTAGELVLDDDGVEALVESAGEVLVVS